MHSPTFPDTFSSKNLTYICVGTLQNIYFNTRDSRHFDKFVFQNWFSLQIIRSQRSTWGPRGCSIFNFKICIFLLSQALFVKISKQFYFKIFINSQTFFVQYCRQKYFTSIFTGNKGNGLSQYNVEVCT